MTDEERPDRPRCAGRTAADHPCPDRARLGSRFCGRHVDQRPEPPVTYLTERLSAHTRRPRRVHLGYAAPDAPTLLCTGTIARTPPRYDPTLGLCPRCRPLAVEAVGRGELEPDTLRRWNLGEPNVDEARP